MKCPAIAEKFHFFFKDCQSIYRDLTRPCFVTRSLCTTIRTSSHSNCFCQFCFYCFYVFNLWDLCYQRWKNKDNMTEYRTHNCLAIYIFTYLGNSLKNNNRLLSENGSQYKLKQYTTICSTMGNTFSRPPSPRRKGTGAMSLGPKSLHPKEDVDPFSRFCMVQARYILTNRAERQQN